MPQELIVHGGDDAPLRLRTGNRGSKPGYDVTLLDDDGCRLGGPFVGGIDIPPTNGLDRDNPYAHAQRSLVACGETATQMIPLVPAGPPGPVSLRVDVITWWGEEELHRGSLDVTVTPGGAVARLKIGDKEWPPLPPVELAARTPMVVVLRVLQAHHGQIRRWLEVAKRVGAT